MKSYYVNLLWDAWFTICWHIGCLSVTWLVTLTSSVLWFSTLHVSACSGIGLALCERLLSQDTESLQLCLACRNMRRAQAARSALLASHPAAQVALLQLDTSSISSVMAAAQEVKLRWEDKTHSRTTEPSLQVCALCLWLGLSAAGTTGWTTSTWTQASCQTRSLMSKPFSKASSPGTLSILPAHMQHLVLPDFWSYFLFQTSRAALIELRFLGCLLCSRVVAMFATAEGILTQKDGITPDGLQEVFATNLFGHFLLVSVCCSVYWIIYK